MVHSQYKANDDYFVHNLFTRSNTLEDGMTIEQLCKIKHYLWILDSYLFGQPERENQRKELEELQKAISAAIQNPT